MNQKCTGSEPGSIIYQLGDLTLGKLFNLSESVSLSLKGENNSTCHVIAVRTKGDNANRILRIVPGTVISIFNYCFLSLKRKFWGKVYNPILIRQTVCACIF